MLIYNQGIYRDVAECELAKYKALGYEVVKVEEPKQEEQEEVVKPKAKKK